MKKLGILLLLAGAMALPADFKAGLDAYTRGDFAAALKEWQPIAEGGDPNAQYNLGLLYARGQGVAQDYSQAAQWYRKAAEQGVAAAQYNLGLMCANGQGVPRDPQEAAKWFLKAADAGVVDAETGLGRIYHEGEGAFQNPAEAEKWYRKAAERGVGSAAFNLGVMYDLGQGVPRNYEEAFQWYRKAADDGYAAGFTNLGILYYNAQGVKRDLVEAYACFSKAQRMGDPRAAQLLSSTANKLKPGDLKKAQKLLAGWQPPAAKPVETDPASLFKPPAEAPAVATVASAAPTRPAETTTAPAASAESAQPTSVAAAPARSDAVPTAPGTPAAAAPAASTAIPKTASEQNTWPEVERVVAVGDVHGDYEMLVGVLQSANLIDSNGDWIGGKAHLVQTGDVVDRGPDSRAVMDLLMKLEKQAAAAGGAVHALIGNHEAMNVYGDLRYVSPAEFATWASGATASREVSYDQFRKAVTERAKPGADPARLADIQNLPGYNEHREAFGPSGVYGKWIRSHNAAVKIGRTLFIHAGLGEKYVGWTLDRIDDEVRQELNDFTRLHGGLVTDEEGPLWYRGLAKGDETKLGPLVDSLLRQFDVDRIVIGHTYADAAITPRFGGKVVLIDIGLSRVYDNIGKMGALEIDHGEVRALHRGQKLRLPSDENGPDMLRYLREAAALDPQPSPIQTRIEQMEKAQPSGEPKR